METLYSKAAGEASVFFFFPVKSNPCLVEWWDDLFLFEQIYTNIFGNLHD